MHAYLTVPLLLGIGLLGATVDSLGTPVHVWPLSYKTLCFDVQKGAASSTLTSTCPLLSTDSQFHFSSFLFDGSGQSAADFKVTPSSVYPKTTFAFFLNPNHLDGVFFEYRTESLPDASKFIFDRVVGELVDGRVRMSVWRLDQQSTMRSSKILTAGVWSSVMLTVNDKDNLVITIGVDQELINIAPNDGVQVPGTLRVGQSWSGDSSFYGKMNCVVVYNDEMKTNEVVEYETNTCPEARWSKQPTGVADCGNGSLPTPSQLWALDGLSGGFEALSGSPPLYPTNTTTCFKNESSHPSLPGAQLVFDGSVVSRLVLPLNQTLLEDGDFTMAVLARPYTPPEGQILTRSLTGTTTGLSRITLGFLANGSLVTSLWTGGPALTPCGQLAVPGISTNSNSWTTLVVRRKSAAGRVELSIEGHVWWLNDACGVGTAAGGQLVLGSSSTEEGAGYRGALACLAIYPAFLPVVPPTEFTQQCQALSSEAAVGTASCTMEYQQDKAFRLVAPYAHPASPCAAAFTSLWAASLIQCASLCSISPSCRSFAITADVTSQARQCQLFDYVSKICLVTSAMSYYEMKSAVQK